MMQVGHGCWSGSARLAGRRSAAIVHFMKKLRLIFFGVVSSVLLQSGLGQGFVNLDFEAATVTPTPVKVFGGPVDPAVAFPGWTIGGGDTYVLYNNETLGSPAVALMGPNFPNATGFTPLQGAYSALIYYLNSGTPTIPWSRPALTPALPLRGQRQRSAAARVRAIVWCHKSGYEARP
jgi:hypothetical protein